MHRLPQVSAALAVPLAPQPPQWAFDLVDAAADRRSAGTTPLRCRHDARFTLLSGDITDAVRLSGSELARAVTILYRAIAAELAAQNRHAVRIWNFVPDIQGRLDDGDRYMSFNVGRFDAYRQSFGGVEAFLTAFPTASAVGVAAATLSVFVLASDDAGQPVENPRQIPSHRYSRQYGLRPPCFARATRVGSTLLIGGTASILGQQSQHGGDITGQIEETCRNIAAVVVAAAPHMAAAPLVALQNARVHIRDAAHAAAVRTLLEERMPHVDIEMVQAPLCRRELLIEIEGVAEC